MKVGILGTGKIVQELSLIHIWQGKTRWHFGYTQYYMTSKLQDGTVCLLQFDYAVPYADPALRGVLPDMQTVHCILGILLLVGAVVWSTHRTGRFQMCIRDSLCTVAFDDLHKLSSN